MIGPEWIRIGAKRDYDLIIKDEKMLYYIKLGQNKWTLIRSE